MIALAVALLATIIDGSDPRSATLQWCPAGDSTYSTVWADPVRAVFADSVRLYAQGTEADLVSGGPYGVAGGWVQVGKRLLVRLPDSSAPSSHRIRVAGPTTGLIVTTPGAVVESVHVAFTGYEGILVMAPGVTVRDCEASNCGLEGIAAGIPASRCTIEDCIVWDNAIGKWPYAAGKHHREEIGGIKYVGGPGGVIRHCTVRGLFNGIGGGTGAQPRQPGADTTAAGLRIEDCTITGVADDAIEVETIDGRDIHIERNLIRGCLNGISHTPLYRGPSYIVGNRILEYREGALKLLATSVGDTASTATIYLIGNTCASLANYAGADGNGRSSGGPLIARNNIFYGTGVYPVVNESGPGDYDYNLYWCIAPRALVRWKGTTYYTLAPWRTATGQEPHGLQADPLFVNPAAGDWTLKPGSPAANAGVCLPEFGLPCSASMGAP